MSHFKTPMRPLVCAVALLAVAGCDNFDIDLRDGGPGTAEAARNASADRPTPDSRGIISYPNYQWPWPAAATRCKASRAASAST